MRRATSRPFTDGACTCPTFVQVTSRTQQYAERSAINAPMQGTAADIIKHAMIAVDTWCIREDVPARLIMQVHDELVLEVPRGCDGSRCRGCARAHGKRRGFESAAAGRPRHRGELGTKHISHSLLAKRRLRRFSPARHGHFRARE